MSTLVLGLGNVLACDDGVGPITAEMVSEEIQRRGDEEGIEIVASSASGLALLEILADHDRAIVIDAILTGRRPAGSIVEMGMDEIGRVVAPSTHQAGLPELAAVAERLGLSFPARTRVFAVEVVDPYTLGVPLTEPVVHAIPELVRRVTDQLLAWKADDQEEAACTTTTPSKR
jgi:hydrogenase maturation protease